MRIAVAANMQFAMEELVNDFEKISETKCEMVVGSSGKLMAQIKEGAPFNLFFSADMKYPEYLFRVDKTLDKPMVYALGEVVLWSIQKRDNFRLSDLVREEIKHIAIANPATAPYGKAAQQLLINSKMLDAVKEKLVYGESIGQTTQFVYSEAAEVGFVSKSMILSRRFQQKGVWINLDKELYMPIEQGVVVIKGEKREEQKASEFLQFVQSEKGRTILRKYGYFNIN
ncbi:molybdate ABC transporter substrate-binding protein [Prolixibacteraceae bacterium JC049]|nr:molybdate ABC transporter substrate-binding protein [Prolixibacteraceae bacterium JC049]